MRCMVRSSIMSEYFTPPPSAISGNRWDLSKVIYFSLFNIPSIFINFLLPLLLMLPQTIKPQPTNFTALLYFLYQFVFSDTLLHLNSVLFCCFFHYISRLLIFHCPTADAVLLSVFALFDVFWLMIDFLCCNASI